MPEFVHDEIARGRAIIMTNNLYQKIEPMIIDSIFW